jgi:hypothetical protein
MASRVLPQPLQQGQIILTADEAGELNRQAVSRRTVARRPECSRLEPECFCQIGLKIERLDELAQRGTLWRLQPSLEMTDGALAQSSPSSTASPFARPLMGRRFRFGRLLLTIRRFQAKRSLAMWTGSHRLDHRHFRTHSDSTIDLRPTAEGDWSRAVAIRQ